jgi:hypothetical protein
VERDVSEVRFEVLAGLEGSGPLPLPFPANNRGISEGFIVRFRPSASEAWTGNFRPGETDYNAVHLHPDQRRIFVIAGGSDYLVDPDTKTAEGHTSDNIRFSHDFPDLELLVFGDHIRFWAESKDGRKWATPRVSWDGIEVAEVSKEALFGRCYSAADKKWHEFELDVRSGQVTGTTFQVDFQYAKPVTRGPSTFDR